jgi:ATP-binding protein involved in chromosome partitioning
MQIKKNNLENIKKIILVLSGKGGVGKSTVSTNIAYSLYMSGNKVGLLDADIHGPNIPLMLGIEGMKLSDLRTPYEISNNLKVASVSFFLENAHNPVVLRGPAKTSTLLQLIEDVEWGDLDYMVVDLPPGTGDEALTAAQNLGNIDGVVIVTTPQTVSLLDTKKSINFAKKLDIPILGIVENMSGLVCPHCNEVVDVFKTGGGEEAAKDLGINFLGKIPLDPGIVHAGDEGKPYVLSGKTEPTLTSINSIVSSISALVN